MTKLGLHAIYGLYLPDQPGVILYVGSWCTATLDERLRQHQDGEARMTMKCAARQGIRTADLRMHILCYWMAGSEPNPEGKITRGLQARGQGRWNHPHAFSTEDSQKGGRIRMLKMSREDRARAGRIGGPIGGRKMQATWGKTPEAHEQSVRTMRKLQEGYCKTPEAHEMHLRVGHKIQELAKTPEGRELFAQTGRIAGLKTQAGWGKTPEAQEVRVHAGRISAHLHWHVNRGIINPQCPLCKAANP